MPRPIQWAQVSRFGRAISGLGQLPRGSNWLQNWASIADANGMHLSDNIIPKGLVVGRLVWCDGTSTR
ncbi:hypothetical protein CDL15_Pgr027978 [Punica granatum]|uniref:Uncharacterized protein n=1 Tax=Punica granatum TaxID=22663 RepID=A0A218XL39_PUNGR|nr:hypothetical protein CDL15_Pgr027978 [Punica granatum]PKI51719.1 hypothetical protein CRG98_027882 [Punica granatum]